ncbi:MAG TPA: hypothetical protein VHA13_00320 [Gammaproteobacteria bacterium]|nr:hypothetical protein [Gammaproteobacteria bacterium]
MKYKFSDELHEENISEISITEVFDSIPFMDIWFKNESSANEYLGSLTTFLRFNKVSVDEGYEEIKPANFTVSSINSSPLSITVSGNIANTLRVMLDQELISENTYKLIALNDKDKGLKSFFDKNREFSFAVDPSANEREKMYSVSSFDDQFFTRKTTPPNPMPQNINSSISTTTPPRTTC